MGAIDQGTIMAVKTGVIAARDKNHAGYKPGIVDERTFYHAGNIHKEITPSLHI